MIRLAGHPLHTALVHMPLGLCPTALLWSLVALADPTGPWWLVSFWTLAVGMAAALPVVVTGLIDLAALRGKEAQAAGNRHMLLMLGALTLFGAGLALRGGGAPPGMPALVVGLDAAGSALMLVGGWQGGELVLRHGAGRVARGDAVQPEAE